MPQIESVDELAEWLADQADVYGMPDGHLNEMGEHTDKGAAQCRVCWTNDVTERIEQSVRNDVRLRMLQAMETETEWRRPMKNCLEINPHLPHAVPDSTLRPDTGFHCPGVRLRPDDNGFPDIQEDYPSGA